VDLVDGFRGAVMAPAGVEIYLIAVGLAEAIATIAPTTRDAASMASMFLRSPFGMGCIS
jgi:hypothetical protein